MNFAGRKQDQIERNQHAELHKVDNIKFKFNLPGKVEL
jgi:hypothetical protein